MPSAARAMAAAGASLKALNAQLDALSANVDEFGANVDEFVKNFKIKPWDLNVATAAVAGSSSGGGAATEPVKALGASPAGGSGPSGNLLLQSS